MKMLKINSILSFLLGTLGLGASFALLGVLFGRSNLLLSVSLLRSGLLVGGWTLGRRSFLAFLLSGGLLGLHLGLGVSFLLVLAVLFIVLEAEVVHTVTSDEVDGSLSVDDLDLGVAGDQQVNVLLEVHAPLHGTDGNGNLEERIETSHKIKPE